MTPTNPLPQIPARPDRIPESRAILELRIGKHRTIHWVWNSYDPATIADRARRRLTKDGVDLEGVDLEWVWRDRREAE